MWLDLGEFVLHVIRVHCADLVASWSAQNFDDLDKLVDTRLAWEKRLTEHELCHDAAGGPHIWIRVNSTAAQACKHKHTDLGGVVCRSKNQLGRPVVTRANVRHVWLVLDKNLGAAEIAQLQHAR